tara:strand:- start:111 stop:800 length:690 start_codon:yes stop_codon:yes gene_type:complete
MFKSLGKKTQAKLGQSLWLLNIQWFVIQFLVACSWRPPGYSLKNNMISDLGDNLISPLSHLMNTSFIITGILSIAGALLLRPLLYPNKRGLLITILLFGGGIGIILVGLNPENIRLPLHLLGAHVAALTVGAIFLASFEFKSNKHIRALSKPSFYGALILLGVGIYYSYVQSQYTSTMPTVAEQVRITSSKADFLGLGVGGMEKFLCYPLIVWQLAVAKFIPNLIKKTN